MLYSVSGRLTHKGLEAAHVQVGGLELEVHSSARSLEALPAPGAEVKMYTFLYHREDQMRLYGFASPAERSLFLDLLRVDGVGPRLVIRILSGIDAAELVQALDANDLPRLVQIPGLGNKTAQKMVLALQGQAYPSAGRRGAHGRVGRRHHHGADRDGIWLSRRTRRGTRRNQGTERGARRGA